MREDAVPGRAVADRAGPGPQPPEVHAVLLAMAGEVDDDLLATAHELAAIGEESQAVELLVASLVADRTELHPAVRSAVAELARLRQIAVDPAALAPAAPESVTHRFAAEPGVAGALLEPARVPRHMELLDVLRAAGGRPAGSRLRLAWRLTPAGTAPGPVPHPVVLVELTDGRTAPEIVAYRLGALLARNGIRASVEAYTSGEPLPPYQLAALRHAVPVDGSAVADGHAGPEQQEPVAEPVTGPAPLTGRARPDVSAVPTPPRGIEPVRATDAEADHGAGADAVHGAVDKADVEVAVGDDPADPPTIPIRVFPVQPLAGESRGARHSQPEPASRPEDQRPEDQRTEDQREVVCPGGHAGHSSADAGDSDPIATGAALLGGPRAVESDPGSAAGERGLPADPDGFGGPAGLGEPDGLSDPSALGGPASGPAEPDTPAEPIRAYEPAPWQQPPIPDPGLTAATGAYAVTPPVEAGQGDDADADPPLLASMHDPLTGPLSQPLLAPLLDPTSGSWALPAVHRPGADSSPTEPPAGRTEGAAPAAARPDLPDLTELTLPGLPTRRRGGPDPTTSAPEAPLPGHDNGDTGSPDNTGTADVAETQAMREVNGAGPGPGEPGAPRAGLDELRALDSASDDRASDDTAFHDRAFDDEAVDPRPNGSHAQAGPVQPDAGTHRVPRDAAGRPRGAWHPDPSWMADWVTGAWAMPRTELPSTELPGGEMPRRGDTAPPGTTPERSGPEPRQPGQDMRPSGPGTQAVPDAWHTGPDARRPDRERRPASADGERAVAPIWLEPAQTGATVPASGPADVPVTAGEPADSRPERASPEPGPAGVGDQASAPEEAERRESGAQPGASPRAPEPPPYGRRAAREGVPTFQPPPGSPPPGGRRARHRSAEEDGEPAPMPPPRPVPRLGHRLGGPAADPPEVSASAAEPAGENPAARPVAPDDDEPELRAFREQLATPWTRRSIPPRPPRTNGHRPQS